MLVRIARGLGYEHAAFDEVWREVTARAPLHRRAHADALQYWCAKWCGSDERMWAFAEQAAALSPQLSVLVMQAAFEQQADPRVWRQPNVQSALDVLLRWLETVGADEIDVRDNLGWAALALVESGRGREAIPLFQRLGTDAGGAPWRYFRIPTATFNRYRLRAVSR